MSIPLNFNQPNLYLRFAKILAVSLFLGLSVPHAQARKQNDQRGVGARPADQVNTLPEKSKHRKPSMKVWTHPTLSDGKLYLRDQEWLFCYEVK